jgi:hypothetical protein
MDEKRTNKIRKLEDKKLRSLYDEKMWEKEIDELKIRNLGIGRVKAEIGL